jgi:predicted DNA-binding protein (MmcQ/YjbR family)
VRMNQILARLRKICLTLPETKETPTWGQPHFRVGEKIFAGCGEEDGRRVIGFKLEREHAEAIVHDPRFRPAPYVGKHGWVSMDAERVSDWGEVRELVLESYRLIAPRRLVAKLETVGMEPEPAPRVRPTAKTGAKRRGASRSSR